MKKILLTLILFASVGLIAKIQAQSCTVTTPVVSNIHVTSGAGGCDITFDLQFDFSGNAGNKWKAFYVWSQTDYNNLPSNFYGASNKSVPTPSALNSSNALATVAICTDSSTSFTLYN